MTTLYIESESVIETQQLLRSAIKGETSRLKLALDAAHQRLLPFEEKYEIASVQFIEKMAAEDLEGGDLEYVEWAGEYRLMERLAHKLKALGNIKYRDSALLRAN